MTEALTALQLVTQTAGVYSLGRWIDRRCIEPAESRWFARRLGVTVEEWRAYRDHQQQRRRRLLTWPRQSPAGSNRSDMSGCGRGLPPDRATRRPFMS
jgi:hypothetical protein